MELVPYEPRWLGDVTRLYHELALLSPCCFPIAADRLARALVPGERPARVVVALEAGEAVGWSHVEVGALEEGQPIAGALRFLTYRPGRRPVGHALLEAAEAFAAEHGAAELVVFDPRARYPFWHLFCGGLTDRALHLFGLLEQAGFERGGGEVFLQWDPLAWPEPAEPLGDGINLTVEIVPGAGRRPGLHLRALRDGEPIGECICRSAAENVPGGAAEEVGFVKWLGVDEPERGRRLGIQLLSRALAELAGFGYPTVIISTSWRNPRAQVFYSNFGACVIDWTFWHRRPIEAR